MATAAIALPARGGRPNLLQAIEAAEKYHQRTIELEKKLDAKTKKLNGYVAENLATQEELKQGAIGVGSAIGTVGLLGYFQGSDPDGELGGFEPSTIFTALGVGAAVIGFSGLGGPHFGTPLKYTGVACLALAAHELTLNWGKESLKEEDEGGEGNGEGNGNGSTS